MKHTALTLLLMLMASTAQAACYADYKAKRDDPLKLHYGVIELSDDACDDHETAHRQISDRLAGNGWSLLKVQSIFDDTGLEERKESAGKFFLRF
ncbi:hypothetical protein FIL88_13150 [Aliiroseovarius halocynthiae]|uniref:DUF4177 domain-containing protein n=2 Tax=Aliiroseovarius halocynthiae TaxID=985055 RepID=A0A545SNY0_9RHOB|nr:hypothetical protein FIL88_13150 [Aliiroseovarius halocynthiae]